MSLIFEESTHRYIWHGKGGAREVPSVTQILQRAGVTDHSFVPKSALQRGTDIHQEIKVGIGCDWEFDPSPHGAQAFSFLLTTKAKVIAHERCLIHKTLWYCGRFDCIAKINGVVYLLDWKVNSHYQGIGPQLAAYREAYNLGRKRNRIEKVAVVVLHEYSYEFIGTESPKWLSDPKTDWQTFKNALEKVRMEDGNNNQRQEVYAVGGN